MRAFVVNLVDVLELRPESQNFALAYVILMLVWNYCRDYRTRVRRFSDVFTSVILLFTYPFEFPRRTLPAICAKYRKSRQ